MIKIEFAGIATGDCECACWEVDRETFIKLKGYSPSPTDRHGKGFRYYLDSNAQEGKRYKVTLILETV